MICCEELLVSIGASVRRGLSVVFLASSLLAPCLVAQDAARDLMSANCDYSASAGLERGELSLGVKSNTLKWWLNAHPDPALVGPNIHPVVASVALPLDRAGSISPLGGRDFLVSGRNSESNSGWLVVVRLGFGANAATPSIAILGQRDLGVNLDPVSAGYNAIDGHIYAFDESTKTLVRAPWTGVASALPTSFSTIMTASQMPRLGQSCTQVAAAPGKSGCIVWMMGRPVTQVRCYLHQSVWKIEAPALSLPLPWNTQWALENPSIQKSQGPLVVKGPAAVVNLIDVLTGATVSSFTNPGGDQWHPWGLPSTDTLAPGYAYQLQGGTYTSSRPFRPLIRWGDLAPADNVKIDHGSVLSSSAFIGNASFAVSGMLHFQDAPSALLAQSTKTCQVYLYVNYYTPGDSAPITTVGPVAYLTPLNVFTLAQPAVLSMKEQSLAPFAGLRIPQPIPNDPNLVNARVLWQWVAVTDSSAVVVSDVFGTSILDAPQQSSSASNGAAPSRCPTGTVSKALVRALNQRRPSPSTQKAVRSFILDMKGGRGSSSSKQLWKAGLTTLRLQNK